MRLSSALLWVLLSSAAFGSNCDTVEVQAAFHNAAYLFDLDPLDLEAQARTENSTCDPKARSRARAIGCGQFLKSTWRDLEKRHSLDLDIENCVHSIFMMALYFRVQYDYFLAQGVEPEEAKKLAWSAYNAGRRGVLRRIGNLTKNTAWVAVQLALPIETQNYTRRIMQLRRRLSR